MTVSTAEVAKRWSLQHHTHGSTADEPTGERARSVLEQIRAILGYDPAEEQLMAEGYHHFSAEAIAFAEGTTEISLESIALEEQSG